VSARAAASRSAARAGTGWRAGRRVRMWASPGDRFG
jgi:hypothetical protein